MSQTTTEPAPGQVWEDTFTEPCEWCSVLHVSPSHVLLQRRFGLGRYPRPDFGQGTRFRFIMVEEEEEPADA